MQRLTTDFLAGFSKEPSREKTGPFVGEPAKDGHAKRPSFTPGVRLFDG